MTPNATARIPLRAILVEDSEEDALLLIHELEQSGYDVRHVRVQTDADLQSALAAGPWDIVLSDHNMPQFNSTAALARVKERQQDLPFIIVSGSIGEEMAVSAMRGGASDYILKDNLRRLAPAIERELREAVERRARREAQRALLAQEEQMRIAREIQQRLFPSAPPLVAGWEFAGASRPADATGGDYFDYIPMTSNMLALVVGDVSGHGLGPALLMAETRECLRALALTCEDIRRMLDLAGRLLASDFGEDRFMTLFLAQLDLGTGRLRYLSAGHPTAFILDAEGKVRARLGPTGPAMGLLIKAGSPAPVELAFAPGEQLLVLTDGILEAFDPAGEEFGMERVLATVSREAGHSAADLVNGLFAAVADFAGGLPQQDDITAVVARWRKGAGS
jgi:phosphoserine phosphatase RsbU/P